MKKIFIILILLMFFAAIIFTIAQTENKYIFTAFEEKLSKVELNFDIFQTQKFLNLKFFTDLPIKVESSKRDNPFNY